MKITSFNPLILTSDPESAIKLFEELGFVRRHKKDGVEGREDTVGIRMKDANGFHVDISQTGFLAEGDRIAIRMNVDDFDEAYKLLTDRGFRNLYGKQPLSTETSRSAMMISPYGFTINLVHHIKKEVY